jgi:hypothetical protein
MAPPRQTTPQGQEGEELSSSAHLIFPPVAGQAAYWRLSRAVGAGALDWIPTPPFFSTSGNQGALGPPARILGHAQAGRLCPLAKAKVSEPTGRGRKKSGHRRDRSKALRAPPPKMARGRATSLISQGSEAPSSHASPHRRAPEPKCAPDCSGISKQHRHLCL